MGILENYQHTLSGHPLTYGEDATKNHDGFVLPFQHGHRGGGAGSPSLAGAASSGKAAATYRPRIPCTFPGCAVCLPLDDRVFICSKSSPQCVILKAQRSSAKAHERRFLSPIAVVLWSYRRSTARRSKTAKRGMGFHLFPDLVIPPMSGH
jgi:hypothetical protein